MRVAEKLDWKGLISKSVLHVSASFYKAITSHNEGINKKKRTKKYKRNEKV
jgi:hypothetical protein